VFCKLYRHANEENEIHCHCLSYEIQNVLIRVTGKFKDTVNKVKRFEYFDRVLTALNMLLVLSSHCHSENVETEKAFCWEKQLLKEKTKGLPLSFYKALFNFATRLL
jgi:hypothetical protein